jgi:hypothetical protein
MKPTKLSRLFTLRLSGFLAVIGIALCIVAQPARPQLTLTGVGCAVTCAPPACTGGIRTTSGGNTIITFLSSGTLTCGGHVHGPGPGRRGRRRQ